MKVEVKKDIFKRALDVPSNKMLKGVFKWTAKYKDEFMACLAIFTFSGKDITENLLWTQSGHLRSFKVQTLD